MVTRSKNQNSYRTLRVASLIRTALEEIFIVGKNLSPNLHDAACNITNLVVSPDLKLVTCYFIPGITSPITHKELLRELALAKVMIRKMIVEKVSLKYAPELRFIYDNGFINAMQVNEVFAKIQAEVIS